jgi:universal stress protein E
MVMKLLKRILVPTDFTAESKEALASAIVLARIYEASIRILHVMPGFADSPIDLNTQSEGLRQRCEEFGEEARGMGIPVEVEVTAGKPVEQIVRVADYHDVDVVVMGAGEVTAGEPFRVGQTAMGVARDAEKPVWVVKHGGGARIRKILCPFDGSLASHHALFNAVHLARDLRADLDVLRVVEAQPKYYPAQSSEAARAHRDYLEAAEVGLEQQLAEYDLHNVAWRKAVWEGEPHLAILNFARQAQTDLIVMGSFGHNFLRRLLLGSNTEQVLGRMPCALLVVKREDAIRLRPEVSTAEVRERFREGQQMLEEGFPVEALQQFQKCVAADDSFSPAWEAMAVAQERLGNQVEAHRCHEQARRILQAQWERRVEAEVRSQHMFWKQRAG